MVQFSSLCVYQNKWKDERTGRKGLAAWPCVALLGLAQPCSACTVCVTLAGRSCASPCGAGARGIEVEQEEEEEGACMNGWM